MDYLKRNNKVEESSVKKNFSYVVTMKDTQIKIANVDASQRVATFQETIKLPLLLGQIFALLPVQGITSLNPLDVRFSFKSWKCVYLLLSSIGQLFMTTMAIATVVNVDSSLKASTTIIFYGTAVLTLLMFMHMSTRWPRLVQRTAKTEQLDPNFDKKLGPKINVTCIVILSLAFAEHLLSLLRWVLALRTCDPPILLTSYEEFATYLYPWVFYFVPYSTITGLMIQFLHFQSTFIWNFSDLFVICMSYYLISRFQQVNKKLFSARGKNLPETYWRSLREEFCRSTQLVRKFDDVIGGVIFITFANNLFFICLQLFNSLENGLRGKLECKKQLPDASPVAAYITSAYFIYSLAFLMIRSLVVSLIAADVNTESLVPCTVLYDVPSPSYCVEVQRFIDQVNGDHIALTGLQFFSITRGLLLTVAATIVTYELVMFQFNSSPIGTNSTLTLNATK